VLPDLPEGWVWATIDQVSECLDSMRIPVNKKERENRQGNIPYYGANGQVGWIDDYLFDEPLVLVVEDETFTGREKPFTYKISGKTWVNNHAHVLRATATITDYLNYSLMFYPFTPLTTGTTGRRKLTQRALRTAPYALPPLAEQQRIVAEVERRLSVAAAAEAAVAATLTRSGRLRQTILQRAFSGRLV
jgi:type I restriction enzyme, S subunit